MERWKGRRGGGRRGRGKERQKEKEKKKREREGEIKREGKQWLERGSQKGYLWGEACSLKSPPAFCLACLERRLPGRIPELSLPVLNSQSTLAFLTPSKVTPSQGPPQSSKGSLCPVLRRSFSSAPPVGNGRLSRKPQPQKGNQGTCLVFAAPQEHREDRQLSPLLLGLRASPPSPWQESPRGEGGGGLGLGEPPELPLPPPRDGRGLPGPGRLRRVPIPPAVGPRARGEGTRERGGPGRRGEEAVRASPAKGALFLCVRARAPRAWPPRSARATAGERGQRGLRAWRRSPAFGRPSASRRTPLSARGWPRL